MSHCGILSQWRWTKSIKSKQSNPREVDVQNVLSLAVTSGENKDFHKSFHSPKKVCIDIENRSSIRSRREHSPEKLIKVEDHSMNICKLHIFMELSWKVLMILIGFSAVESSAADLLGHGLDNGLILENLLQNILLKFGLKLDVFYVLVF